MNLCHYCQAPVASVERHCPRCGTDLWSALPSERAVGGTAVESVLFLSDPEEHHGAEVTRQQELPVTSFRPILRPPMAVLGLLDDGSRQAGEYFRLRADSTLIGRTEGDVVIPHDCGISGRHAQITRYVEEGQFRWRLDDLASTNGTFVKAAKATLKQGQEMLIGGRRFRFEPGAQLAAVASARDRTSPVGPTRGWQVLQGIQPDEAFAALIELVPAGTGLRLPLSGQEHWLGSSSALCDLALINDPYVSPRHARLFQDERRRWRIEDNQSVNGLWLRVESIPLLGKTEFQLGEQRFLVCFP